MGPGRRKGRCGRGAVDEDVRPRRAVFAAVLFGAMTLLGLAACTTVPPEGVSEEEVRKLQPISVLLTRTTVYDTCRLYEAGDLQRQFILAEASRCPQTPAERRMITTIRQQIERIEASRDQYRYLTCGELVAERKAPLRFDCGVCQEFIRRWGIQQDTAREELRKMQAQIARGEGCVGAVTPPAEPPPTDPPSNESPPKD